MSSFPPVFGSSDEAPIEDPMERIPPLFMLPESNFLSGESPPFSLDEIILSHNNQIFDWGLSSLQCENGSLQDDFQIPSQPPSIPNVNSKPNEKEEIIKALKAEEVDGQSDVEDLPDGSPNGGSWVSDPYLNSSLVSITMALMKI